MATQILRKIDRWRFEAPLALALGASAGFVMLVMPGELFGQIPALGGMGDTGRLVAAVAVALLCGVAGYLAMRRPSRAAAPEKSEEEIEREEYDRPSGMPNERLRRFRRADAHPDAPPREPIRASRDLGEPFMDVGGFAAPPPDSSVEWWPDSGIPDGDFVELGEADSVLPEAEAASEAVSSEAPAEVEPMPTPVQVAAAPEAAPAAPSISEPRPAPQPASRMEPMALSAMMDRLTAGMQRRASMEDIAIAPAAPARDMRPALRDALEELNRLAERRG